MARPWSNFVATHGSEWQSMWDQSTGVPVRIFGRGISAPNAVASAKAAEHHARTLLSQYLDLLAPGADPADFVLVSNVVHNGLRTVGFHQYWRGMRVLGGQVGFQFKNDRLIVIGSKALPHVNSRLPSALVQTSRATKAARDWVAFSAARLAYSSGTMEGPMILPIIEASGVRYRTVMRTTVDAVAPFGEWDVYLDAETGLAVARQQNLMFASGDVLFNVPVRFPTGARGNFPAKNADVIIGNATQQTSADGGLSWLADAPISVIVRSTGPLVRVHNDLAENAEAEFTVSPNGTIVWDGADISTLDAQLSGFIHASVVKEYSRRFAGDLEWLDEEIPVNVNLDDTCNAFSNRTAINFFLSSENCENTARLADVVYHEFGHSLHWHALIEGMGGYDPSFGEGVGDYLAATINNDPAMGRGFFYTEEPLRHIDPEDKEHRWPDDIGEVHYTGLIFAGAMWDLRKIFVEKMGEAEGIAYADQLFYAAMQNAVDIPTSYVAVLTEDDDDGDLANGTPNVCDINAAFGPHGLRTVHANMTSLDREDITPDGHALQVALSGLYEQCPSDGIDKVTLTWRLRHEPETSGTAELSQVDDLIFAGTLPTAEFGVVNYKIETLFEDGSFKRFPSNVADPWYEFYAGDVVELYCTNFDEENPFENGWSHGLSGGESEEGADDWQWGPLGAGTTNDPVQAFSGAAVIGNDLGAEEDFNGAYQANKINYALSPLIETGHFSDVRLHYRRWLNVEDAYFDKATIYANDRPAWQNLNSDRGDNSNTHHRDSMWRFHDVSLSAFITDGTVQVKFEIDSDGGLEFGGWTIDDFCIVAASDAICGDGLITGIEDCDEGVLNSNLEANACRENCRAASCGDGVIDRGEQCDDGNNINDDECSSVCEVNSNTGCGFNVSGKNRSNGLWVLLALLFVMVRPRSRELRN
jgi:cysteine-rich repeat protein